MEWANWINVILSVVMLWLTITILKLNKTMTKIAEDEKLEKTGHDLSVVLPMSMYDKETRKSTIANFCIVNYKNRTEAIYRIYVKKHDIENDFWFAMTQPLIVAPYSCVLIPHNVFDTKQEVVGLIDSKIFAVMNDCTIELQKNVNCYHKPL